MQLMERIDLSLLPEEAKRELTYWDSLINASAEVKRL